MTANNQPKSPGSPMNPHKMHNIRGDSNGTENESDNYTGNHEARLEEGMSYFDSFQEKKDSSFDSGSSNNSECMLNDAVSSALVGENVVDSPSQSKRVRKTITNIRRTEPPPALSSSTPTRRQATTRQQTPKSASATNSISDPLSLSVGFVAQGFAWIREQRDDRRRRYLQYQAEQQARKIEAEAAKLSGKDGATVEARSLVDNPTFRNIVRSGSNQEGNDRLGTQSSNVSVDSSYASGEREAAQISYSGDGYTVELAVDDDDDQQEELDSDWVPPVRIEEEENTSSAPFLLTEAQRQCVARSVLPKGIAYAKWKRLYSLARDGDSFEACLRLVKGHSQTLMVVRTSKNEILGGFGDMAWETPAVSGTVYHGGPTSCLYSFVNTRNPGPGSSQESPDSLKALKDIRVYKWSGANRYIQLCDTQHKMLAFGGGGNDGAFGLSVAQDFQHGSSGPCATFHNETLSSNGTFTIVDVELYCFLLGQF
mmetsp:Transcript_1662/g.3549  ORF Transcript_1662/g.3549 Transcript_1662/m.3549 type:complete len:483 (-) Transcript_1662:109-1557(-)